MKKFFLFVCIYVLFLCIPLEAKKEYVSYRLYMDSQNQDIYESKEKILNTFDLLCRGVDEDACLPIIKNEKDRFKISEDTKVKIKKDVLIIVMGDGKGEFIKGNFRKGNVCFEEVKPKSKIQEWFQF